MIWSVSTSARLSGMATPRMVFTACMLVALPVADVDEVAGDRGGGGHRGTDQVGAAAGALPSLEVAVRGAGTALAGQQEVRVHAQAHRATRIAPFEAGGGEDFVEAFCFGLGLDQARAGHHHR